MLIRDLSQTGPVTRAVVLDICLYLFSIILMIVFALIIALIAMSKRWYDIQDRVMASQHSATCIMERMTTAIQKLEERTRVPPKAERQ
jgi:hypothetical protein